MPRKSGASSGLILTVLLAFATAACGFRPLYGPLPTTEAVPERPTAAEQLARVRILRLSNREGLLLYNLLRDRLNPAGVPTKPAYVLSLSMASKIQQLGIRKDETASRANLILDASYSLRLFGKETVITGGRTRTVNSYNILNEFFATTVSEDDALKRGLRVIADTVALRLAVFFTGPLDSAAFPAPEAASALQAPAVSDPEGAPVESEDSPGDSQ